MSKVTAIIQARMGSTRFPGKILLDIAGQPMLGCVVARVRQTQTIDQVLVATSTSVADDVVETYCNRANISYFRGSEDDVLDRYYQAARHTASDICVRITADCPLIDPRVIDNFVSLYLTGAGDYIANLAPPTFPDGLDTEVFSFEVLEQAWREATWQSEREHVTPYVRSHPDLFRILNVTNCEDLSHLRWTVDQEEDLTFIRGVYEALGTSKFGLQDVLDLLRRHPGLDRRECPAMRNEGLAKSLREDRKL